MDHILSRQRTLMNSITAHGIALHYTAVLKEDFLRKPTSLSSQEADMPFCERINKSKRVATGSRTVEVLFKKNGFDMTREC